MSGNSAPRQFKMWAALTPDGSLCTVEHTKMNACMVANDGSLYDGERDRDWIKKKKKGWRVVRAMVTIPCQPRKDGP